MQFKYIDYSIISTIISKMKIYHHKPFHEFLFKKFIIYNKLVQNTVILLQISKCIIF